VTFKHSIAFLGVSEPKSFRHPQWMQCVSLHVLLFVFFKARLQNCEKRLLVSSCPSVCRSVRMQQLLSHWTDFDEIWLAWTSMITYSKTRMGGSGDRVFLLLRTKHFNCLCYTAIWYGVLADERLTVGAY
jgi:hypothetical protein